MMSNNGLTGETRATWWHALFNSADDALVVCDREGLVLQCNRRARRLFGRNQPLGSVVYNSLSVQTAARLKELFQQGRQQSESLCSVTLSTEGRLRLIVDLAVSRLDEGHWLLTIRDASRRWRMETHVHRLMSALDATPDVFFLTDTDYKITYVNAAFQNATGHNIEETLGRSADFLRAPECREKVTEYIAAVEAGTDWVGELVNQRRDGSFYPVEATIAPIYDRGGEMLGYVACERDVEAKKKLESEVEAQRNALYQAQKLKTIGALAAGIAHEFNNLLMVIRGKTSLLQQGADPDTSRRHLQRIDEASSRAAHITQQLLAFSVPSSEAPTVFDFNEFIRENAQLATPLLRPDMRIEVVPAATETKIRMDLSRAHQVLMNLAVNAQDAMPHGGTISISNLVVQLTPEQATRANAEPGALFLRCSVKDTGRGIPEDILPRIFDPFFTTKETGQGPGLGLSVVHGLISQAGGFIEVESKVGQGTTLHLFLPLSEVEPGAELPAEGEATECSGKILVVEDIDLVLEFTCEFLGEMGFTAHAARNAEEALQILAKEPIDLILTDFNMPGTTGLDLIAKVRAGWPNVKCILASGYLDEKVESRLANEFKAETLRKPYNVVEAADLIARLLNQESSISKIKG